MRSSTHGCGSSPNPTGAVLCWTSAFAKDLVVHESWRRRGLGEALLLHAFNALATRGATAVELKVEAANRSAVRLYERLGMQVVARLHRTWPVPAGAERRTRPPAAASSS
jgi:ribosomal protein S18 acetylase RimI-like enzyme